MRTVIGMLPRGVQDLPEDTIVVIEDIDALFAKDRSAKNSKSPLSFSGLLNALDGVGCASGQVRHLSLSLPLFLSLRLSPTPLNPPSHSPMSLARAPPPRCVRPP